MPAIIDFVNITDRGKHATNSGCILCHYANFKSSICHVYDYEIKIHPIYITSWV